jgi:hypothetical protein
MNESIVFKVKPLGDETPWEEIESLGTLALPYADAEKIDDLAMRISFMLTAECRWNYSWSQQGHYCCDERVWQAYIYWKKQYNTKEEQNENLAN